MQFEFGDMSAAIHKLRTEEGDFADMGESARDFSMQAGKHKDLRAEIQKEIDDASNTRLRHVPGRQK